MSKEEQEQAHGKARGGIERAKRLSPEERSEIARKGAAARWGADLRPAICGSSDSPLRIADVEIECYVLDDGTRVLTQATLLQALGRHRKANVRREGGEERVPAILQGKSLQPFISDELREKSKPIPFQLPNGGRALGYDARLLPKLCSMYLKARDAGELNHQLDHVALRADILIRGLAETGIVALVDEATGYQDFRAKDALARILEQFVDDELKAWVQTFPNDYYRELFRLRGLDYPQETVQRPRYFGHLTNNIVYERLAPGVLEELKRVTPRDTHGRHKQKLFQRLTTNVGYPKLREHLGSVVTIMKLSSDWRDFSGKLDTIHPKYGDTLTLPLDYGEEDTGVGL